MTAEFRVDADDGRTFLVRPEKSWRPEVRFAVAPPPPSHVGPPNMSASDARMLGKALIAAAEESEMTYDRSQP